MLGVTSTKLPAFTACDVQPNELYGQRRRLFKEWKCFIGSGDAEFIWWVVPRKRFGFIAALVLGIR